MNGNDKNINIDIKASVDGAGFSAGVAQTERVSEAMKRAEYAAGQASRGNDALGLSYDNLKNKIHAVAAAYGLYKVFDYARDAALLSARYETLGVSMQVVGNNAGYTASEMEAAAVGMQKTGISMIESRQQALRLVQANIDLSQSSKLARIAQDAAVIGNINSSEAFARMIHGIQTGQTDVLRSIGLNISMEQSYAAYAATLGKSANALTQTEKTQAVLNAVMQEGEAIAGTYEAAMGTAGKQLNSMKRYTEDLQLQLGKVFDAPLAAGIGQFTEAIKFASENVGGILAAVKGLTVATGAYIALKSGAAVYEFATALVASRVAALAAAQANYNMVASNMMAGTTQKAAAAAALAQASANMTLTGSLVAATTAMRAFLLTNPIGWITLALGVGATAWFAWGDEAKKAGDKASTAANETMNVFSRWERIRKDREAAAKADAAAKAEAYKTQKKTTDDYIASLEKETAAIGKNAYERKYLEAMSKMQTAATKGQREEIMRGFAAWSLATQAEEENTAAKKANGDAAKAAEEAAKAATKAEQDYMSAIGKETESLIEKAKAAELENAKIGMTAEQLARLTGQRYDEQIAVLATRAAALDGVAGREAELFLIEQQIEALSRLKSADTQRPFLDNQKKANDEVGRGLTDALMRGFEKGYGYAENLAETVKNMFSTMVLRPIISAVMSPVSGAITAGMGAMGFSGAANAAGTGGGNGGGMGWLTNFGGNMADTATSAGVKLYNMGAQDAGSWMIGNADTIGNVADVAGAAMSYYAAFNAAKDGQWATAIGTAAGQYFGGPIGAFIGNTIGGWIDGPIKTPTASTGHAVIDYDAAGKQTGYQSLYGVRNAATDATAAGMNASYRNIANSLGIGTVATQFGYAGNTGKNGEQPMFGLNGGAVGGPQFVQGETAYSEAAMGEAASRAVFAALQGSNLPGYLAGVFNGLDASKMSGQDISNTLAFAGALKQVRDGLTSTATPISVAQDALDKIGSTAASFTADFVAAIDTGMTPEKLALWQQAGAALGSLGDMSLTMSAAVPQLTQSTWEMWNTQTNSVRGLISTFDGSVEATYALSAATRERYATEQQLVDQISGAMSSLGAMFAGSAEQMQLSVMDAQAKSNYFVDQANSLQLQMEAATDPARIEELARSYNEASNNAWANLDDTQRKLMLDSYLENTEQVNTLVQDKLGRTLDEITQDSKNELPALIAQAVENAMTAFVAAQQAVADAQAAAANTIQSAANTMQAVADKPVNVKVDVDFNANVPGSSQVAVLP